MDIFTLLEHLADSAHHRLDINKLTCTQPPDIQKIFLLKNSTFLKKKLCDVTSLPDKNMIF